MRRTPLSFCLLLVVGTLLLRFFNLCWLPDDPSKSDTSTVERKQRIPRPGLPAVLQALAKAEPEKYLSNKGDFEAMQRMLNIWKSNSLCNRKSVVLVGGTNEGQSSLNILSSCPDITLYGFEIQKKEHEIAREMLSPYEGVTLFNMGWSDISHAGVGIGGKGEIAGLYNPEEQPIRRRKGDVWQMTNATVSTIKLSEWANEHLYPHQNILYLLIDVEGHEPKVIRGMQLDEVLNQKRFSMFQYELGGTWAKHDIRHGGQDEWTQLQVAEYLEERGYSLFLLGTVDLLPIGSGFFSEEGNVAMLDEGYGKFIQGNALAVHTRFAPTAVQKSIYSICRTEL